MKRKVEVDMRELGVTSSDLEILSIVKNNKIHHQKYIIEDMRAHACLNEPNAVDDYYQKHDAQPRHKARFVTALVSSRTSKSLSALRDYVSDVWMLKEQTTP